MIKTVTMPKQGLQMTEGIITKWYYNTGDRISSDKPLFQMETDKLTIDIDSQYDGILLQIIRNEGETVLITEPIAFIGSENDMIPDKPATETALTDINSPISVFATPRAKKSAIECGIDYKKIKGSGYNGIIIERDINNFKIGEKSAVLTVKEKQPDKNQKIADESATHITEANHSGSISINTVQAYQRIKADISDLLKLLNHLKSLNINTGTSAVIAYAAVKALSAYSRINADSSDINLGIIMPCADQYKTAEIKNAGHLSLTGLSESMQSAEVKDRRAVFAFADFGKFEIDESFIPLRDPLVAVLTAGTVSEIPAVLNGILISKQVINLVLSYNNNKINDFYASEYLKHIKFLIETPNLLLI